jgi:hypothetical protein
VRARIATLTLAASLLACAEGTDGPDPVSYTLFDSAVVHAPPPEEVVIVPAYDAGAELPPVVPISRVDAGNVRDAGSASDASSPQIDTSPPSGPVDSGTPKPADAAADTSAPKPADAGSDSSAATNGQMCATTPSYPTTTSCAKCTCTKCATQVATGYASSDSAKNAQCASVQTCAEINHCAGSNCYCGDALLCLNPSGACRSVIESAAGATDPLAVQRAADDANSGLGRANAIGSCQLNSCKSECGL